MPDWYESGCERMLPNFLLRFSGEHVEFRHLVSSGHWAEFGRLKELVFWDSLNGEIIRRRAVGLGGGIVATIVILWDDIVSHTHVAATADFMDSPDEAIRRQIAHLTERSPESFSYDWIIEDDMVLIAYVENRDFEKLIEFVDCFGFHTLAIAGMPTDIAYKQPALFKMTDLAHQRGTSEQTVRQALRFPFADVNPLIANKNRSSGIREPEKTPSHASRRHHSVLGAAAVAAFAAAMSWTGVFETSGTLEAAVPPDGSVTESSTIWTVDSHHRTTISNFQIELDQGILPKIFTADWATSMSVESDELPIAATDPKIVFDRGFDPEELSYPLLNLVAATRPNGHELLPSAGTDRTASTTGSSEDGQVPSSAWLGFALRGDSFFDSVPSQPALSTEDLSRTGTGLDETNSLRSTVSFPDTRADNVSWSVTFTDFDRPTLREGARFDAVSNLIRRPLRRDAPTDADQPIAFADFPRPVLRESLPIETPSIPFKQPLRRDDVRIAARQPERTEATPEVQPIEPAQHLRNTIDLNKVNLVGIYGSENFLRALVRHPDGRVQSLYTGSPFDGGEVVEITQTTVNYIRNGEVYQLSMPN